MLKTPGMNYPHRSYSVLPKSLHLIASMAVLNKDENAGRLSPVKFEDAVKRSQTKQCLCKILGSTEYRYFMYAVGQASNAVWDVVFGSVNPFQTFFPIP